VSVGGSMVFSSNIFIFCFLPLTLIGYFLLDKKFQNYFLLLISIIFYAWGEVTFVFIMILSMVINYIFTILIDRYRKIKKLSNILLVGSIGLNLGILINFKYLGFIIENINNLTGSAIPEVTVALPIGISFFTFQALSYVIDVYRNQVPVQKNPFYLALYISFFPQLIAGPIVRYIDIEKQITERSNSLENFSHGAKRFMVGVSKKVLLANTLALVADKAFTVPHSELSVTFAWLGAFAYSFQIFFDFSGYSDMAIGLGEMFGFHFLENFNYPYISKSISEFWRRWHMSLGTWFRDYVYFPLGGSRVKRNSRVVFNLFVVWFLTGLWHGASWNFVIWGLLYFILITFEKLSGYPKKFEKKIFIRIYQLFTLLCILMGWVLFRSEGLRNAVNYIKAMFKIDNNLLINNLTFVYIDEFKFYFIFAILFSIPLKNILFKKAKHSNKFQSLENICTIILFLVSIAYLSVGSYNPFIYFNF